MTTTVHMVYDMELSFEPEELDGVDLIEAAKAKVRDRMHAFVTYENVEEGAITILIQDPEYQHAPHEIVKSAISKKLMDDFMQMESDEAGLWSGI